MFKLVVVVAALARADEALERHRAIGSQIYDLVAAQSPYATAGRIHTHGDWHHIVVVGELGANDEKLGRQLPVLLEQLYHPERGSVDIELQVVLLHAICSWRDDGLLYHERLRDGIVRESCHISLVDIPPAFVDERYLKFFDYCNAHAALPIGLLRVPHGATDRSLPYVYTTPRAYDFVHAGDKAFVLATSVWFGEHGGESIKHDEEELEACVKVATRRGSAVFLPPPSDAKDPTRGGTRRSSGLAVDLDPAVVARAAHALEVGGQGE